MSKSLIPVLAAPADAPKAETKAEVEVDSTITAKADAPKAEAEVCAEVLVTSTTTQVPANANTETNVPKAETLANSPLKIEEKKMEDKGNNNNKPAVVEEESKEEVSRKRKSMGESAMATSVVVRQSIGPTAATTITKKNKNSIDKDDDKISYENTNICPTLNMIRMAEKEEKLPPATTASSGNCDDNLFLHPSLPAVTVTSNTNTNLTKTTENELEAMVLRAIEKSRTGGLVVEGTSGSTGIALATLCASRGHACLVVLPDDQAVEKQRILRALGAIVYEVPTASISNPKHYVNLGRKAALLAREKFGISAVFIDQFENLSNFDIHYRQTGPELWKQLDGRRLDAFCMSSGTGGTISGMASFLKEKKKQNRQKNNYRNHLHNLLRIIGLYYFDDNNDDNVRIKIVLVEPPGSVLYNKVEHGVAYAVEQRERSLRKHRYDTIAEGIGLDRVTRNFSSGFDCIDSAIRVTDQEAVDMAHWILHIEGLWIGSSSAMNVVGAIRTALSLPEGSSVATIICDGGQRHATRFWDPTFIKKWGLQWPGTDCIPECLQSIQN